MAFPLGADSRELGLCNEKKISSRDGFFTQARFGAHHEKNNKRSNKGWMASRHRAHINSAEAGVEIVFCVWLFTPDQITGIFRFASPCVAAGAAFRTCFETAPPRQIR